MREGFLQGAWRIGRIWGIPIRLHYSWFIIFGLITWSLSSYYFPEAAPDLSIPSYWIKGVLASILLFASVAFHELAHSYVALKHRVGIQSITLFIFGGVAQMKGEPPNPKAEFQIALAGPLSSFFLSGIFLLAALMTSPETGALFSYLARINLILGLFNLIPGFPMDGGRLLRSALWKRRNDYVAATQKASTVGKVVGILFIFSGLFSFFMGFPGGLWFLLIGWFVFSAAQSSYLQASLQDALQGIRVGDVMVKSPDIVFLSPSMTVDQAVSDFFLRFGYGGFPVLEGDRLLGITSLKEIKNVPRERWPEVTVREVLVPHQKRWELSPEDEVLEALRRMLQEDQGRIVVTRNGRVIGLITRNGISRYIQLMSR
jgi:Zn-dependent protease/CBS domain-containing protein